MKKRTFIALAAAALLQSAVLLSASLTVSLPAQAQSAPDALARVKAAGVLKVGEETAFAPFAFIKDGEHIGFNVDLYGEIAKELGVKIEWVLLPWEGVLPGLEVGKFDVVGGPAIITKARLERYRFTTPIVESTVALLKRQRDNSINKPEDIAGKTVGAARTSSQLAQLKAFGDTLPRNITVREYPGNNEAYADLANGRIAAMANSLPNISYVAQQRPGVFAVVLPPFGVKTYFGYPSRKDVDSTRLYDAINGIILKMKADGRLAALQQKWLGTTFDTPDSLLEPAV